MNRLYKEETKGKIPNISFDSIPYNYKTVVKKKGFLFQKDGLALKTFDIDTFHTVR